MYPCPFLIAPEANRTESAGSPIALQSVTGLLTQLASSMSLLCFTATRVMPGFTSLQRIAWALLPRLHRYYVPLRLPLPLPVGSLFAPLRYLHP